jgi:glucose 1-dehydrogenase
MALQADVSDPQKRGVVLSTSSLHEESAWSGYSAYTASKAAVSPK